MNAKTPRVLQMIEISAHQELALETEFGTTVITVIPHLSGGQRYTISLEYFPCALSGSERTLELRRN